MDLYESKVGDAVVLEPEGNLIAAADCQALERKLSALVDARSRQIIIDGGKVGQIGSGAVRALLLVSRKLVPLGGRLVLCALPEKVRMAFKISGFDEDFTIVASREDALAKAEESLSAANGGSSEHPLRALVLWALALGVPDPGVVPRVSGRAAPAALRDRVLGLLKG